METDESALICDLAETYHIYDYRSLPLRTVATFSVGLRENSRIKMSMAGIKYTFDTVILAAILDNLNMRAWAMSEDGQSGINKPQSIVSKILDREVCESEYMLFDTAEAFEKMWNDN